MRRHVSVSVGTPAWLAGGRLQRGLRLITGIGDLTPPHLARRAYLPHMRHLPGPRTKPGSSRVVKHLRSWARSQFPAPTFRLLGTFWFLTCYAQLLRPASACVPTPPAAAYIERATRLPVCSPRAHSSPQVCARPHPGATSGWFRGDYSLSSGALNPASQELARSAVSSLPQKFACAGSVWRPGDSTRTPVSSSLPSRIQSHRPACVQSDFLARRRATSHPNSWGHLLCFLRLHGPIPDRRVEDAVYQPPPGYTSTTVVSSRILDFRVQSIQSGQRCEASTYTCWRWHCLPSQHQARAWHTETNWIFVSHKSPFSPSMASLAWLPAFVSDASPHAVTWSKCRQQPLGGRPLSAPNRERMGGRAPVHTRGALPPNRERDQTLTDFKKPVHTQYKPLSFAEFKRANMWVEQLISEHLVATQRRGPLNEPPRPGPSSEWEMLAEGRVLKRQVAGGEGDALPTLRSNVTIEFSLYSLGGTKITDNRAFNTTMMEFPVANAVPGMQAAVTTMRKLERSVFLLAPEMVLPSDFNVSLVLNRTQSERPASAVHSRDRTPGRSSKYSPLNIRLTGGEWLAFDITMCNMYDKDARWWRLGPDVQLVKELPEESIPSNVTHDEWLEHKADTLRKKIEGEMLTNPNSHYWEDIEPAMTPAQREKIDKYTSRLYGLDKPPDPRRDGSRGFRDHTLSRSGGIRHGYELGDRMTGASKYHVWRETLFSFEILLFIRKGIRSDHITWDINSRRMDIFFGGKKVFGDEFMHTVAFEDGAAWTLTDAACRYPAMDIRELQALYEAVPLSVPIIPTSTVTGTCGSPAEVVDLPTDSPVDKQPLQSSYAHPGLLDLAPEEVEDGKLPVDRPALHIILQKGRNWTQMWGSPFKFI